MTLRIPEEDGGVKDVDSLQYAIMGSRWRAVVYFLFLLGFLISAPVVVLYTAGYRLNVRAGKIVQTGLISVSSVPKGVSVIVDGTPLNAHTPTLVDNVFPGEHRVRLVKDGYSAWEKTLPVSSRTTTFVTNVVLFLTADPELIRPATVRTAAIERDGSRIAFLTSDGPWSELWVYDTRDGSEKLLARHPADPAESLSLRWSTNGSYLAFATENRAGKNLMLINTSDGTSVSATDLVPGLERGWWDAGDNKRYIAATADALFLIDLPLGKAEPFPVAADAVMSRGDASVIVEKANDRVTVSTLRDEARAVIAFLPAGSYRFQPAPDGLLMLEDTERNRLVLLDDTGSKEPILLETPAALWQWEPNDKQRLLYSDGYDLHVYDAQTHMDDTITRVSAAITALAWYPTGTAVLFSQDSQLTAIELDHRDSRNVTVLTQGSDLRYLLVDPRGNNAYFFENLDDNAGIYQRTLQR